MIDPRAAVVEERLASVKRIVGVAGGKGGVGKTVLAVTTALLLAREGHRVGLFDLDFSGPSSHLVLGTRPTLPREDQGIVPPRVHGVAYLSVLNFLPADLGPLRGEGQQQVLLELLAITRWDRLDFLVLDMPPGLSDLCLDAFRWIPRAEYLVPTTASPLALAVAERLLRLLGELRLPVIGVVENMSREPSRAVLALAERSCSPFLGRVRWDAQLEATFGRPQELLASTFAEDVRKTILPALV